MKLFKQITLILIVFLKTGNLLSDNNLFNVNNILLEKKDGTSSKFLADKAIKSGFDQLTKRVLMKEDVAKVSDLNFSNIKELVTYYNISKNSEEEKNKVNFSVTFDKDKIHNLFYKRGISYSDIEEKEFYILPILSKKNEIFIFSNNYFYERWNDISENDLIEFILPLENIEIIQNINKNKDNILSLNLESLFKEYSNKNLALVIIEETNKKNVKVYLKTKISGKNIDKSLLLTNNELIGTDKYNDIIVQITDEITSLVKAQNLIDVRTPSFLNARLLIDKKNNLVELNKRLQNINLIDDIFVQEFNNEFVLLKIKFIGKVDRILKQLENQKIILKLKDDQWSLKII